MPPAKSDRHLTPDIIFEIIEDQWGYKRHEMHDPFPENTPHNAPIFFNGLYGDWKQINIINPPYKKKQGDTKTMLALSVYKALEQAELGNHSIMLLPSKTDQRWFHEIAGYEIVWLEGRLRFKNNKDNATQPHFLVMIK